MVPIFGRVVAATAARGALALVVPVVVCFAQESRPSANDAYARLLAAVAAQNETATIEAARDVAGLGVDALPALTRAPAGRDASDLVWTLRCLRNMSEVDATDFILALANHPSADVRAECLKTAAEVCPSTPASVYLDAVVDKDVVVRRRALDGLLRRHPRAAGATDAAVLVVADADFWVFDRALAVLDAAIAKSNDPQWAAAVVGKFDDVPAKFLPQVAELLRRKAPETFRKAASTLLRSKRSATTLVVLDTVAVLRLSERLHDVLELVRAEDVDVARAACRCLGAIGDASVAPELVDLLEAAEEKPRREAIAIALRATTGALHGYDVDAWRRMLAKARSTR